MNPGRQATMTKLVRLVVLILLLAAGVETFAAGKLRQNLEFAKEMARKGNWREARFRWQQADALSPNDPRILNNLGVAAEILGEPDTARDLYERAHSLAPKSATIAENITRFRSYLEDLRPGDEPVLDDLGLADLKRKPPKGAYRVSARFNLPPRLDVSNFASVLVASFKTQESDEIDVNREVTRYLRGEFHKRSKLEVREVIPAPAIPEQTVEDLLANAEFWKHLGREYDADLVVSGVLGFDRREVSGFRDVDIVSPTTGQKVRETRFVEEEEFSHSMQVFFMDGRTGELVFRDSVSRSAVYPGTTNDPLSAFFGLIESIVRDVLAAVSPRVREDVRLVFDV